MLTNPYWISLSVLCQKGKLTVNEQLSQKSFKFGMEKWMRCVCIYIWMKLWIFGRFFFFLKFVRSRWEKHKLGDSLRLLHTYTTKNHSLSGQSYRCACEVRKKKRWVCVYYTHCVSKAAVLKQYLLHRSVLFYKFSAIVCTSLIYKSVSIKMKKPIRWY